MHHNLGPSDGFSSLACVRQVGSHDLTGQFSELVRWSLVSYRPDPGARINKCFAYVRAAEPGAALRFVNWATLAVALRKNNHGVTLKNPGN